MTTIEIGRMLRAGTSGFVVGCRVSQLNLPSFGALVSVPLEDGYQVYGLIHDIHIDDDRLNRNVPVEMSVLTVGYQQDGRIYHLLPPRPPLSLDMIYLCSAEDLRRFTRAGRFGYLRHILRAKDRKST